MFTRNYPPFRKKRIENYLFNPLSFHNPIIEIQKTSKELNMAFNTVSSVVRNLCAIGILEQTSIQSRNRTFAYKEYLNILKSGT